MILTAEANHYLKLSDEERNYLEDIILRDYFKCNPKIKKIFISLVTASYGEVFIVCGLNDRLLRETYFEMSKKDLDILVQRVYNNLRDNNLG